MAIDPRTVDEITDELQASLSGKIAKLTNFVESSFNKVWIRAYGEELHEAEAKLLAAQLSGWVNYAGNDDLDQTDLDQLGVDGVEPDEINDLMDDQQLDRLAPIVGIERDPGQEATGQVTVFTATDDTRVPEGMEVATEPGPDGEYKSYFVDADGDGTIEDSGYVTPNTGKTQVTVDVIADAVGNEYNVGAGTVTFLPNPPTGVEGVTNNTEITGGQDEQSNEEFRQDIKNAVFESAGGGTSRGIIGYVDEHAENVSDVAIDEFVNQQPPYVDVIVDGGSDADVRDAIAASRPTGIEHNLVRPETIGTGVRTELVGTDIDTSFVNDEIEEYLTQLDLDAEFRRSQLQQKIMNADDDIGDLGTLSIMLLTISGESETYQSGTSVYELDFSPLGKVGDEEFLYDTEIDIYPLLYEGMADSSVTLFASVNGNETELVEGTDYEVIDDDGDGNNDSIDFSVGGVNPDQRSIVDAEYTHSSWTIDSTIKDKNGNTYDQGTDWALTDADGDGLQDSIDWSIGGSSPNDGVRWFVTYSPKRTVARDLGVSKREKVSAGSRINVNTFDPVNS